MDLIPEASSTLQQNVYFSTLKVILHDVPLHHPLLLKVTNLKNGCKNVLYALAGLPFILHDNFTPLIPESLQQSNQSSS